MGGCSAPNCTNRPSKGKRMFIFPRDLERRQKWVSNCGRTEWCPTNNSKLCEVHFEDFCFENHRADNWKKLRPDAIPTIFNNVIKPDKPPKTKRIKRKVPVMVRKRIINKPNCEAEPQRQTKTSRKSHDRNITTELPLATENETTMEIENIQPVIETDPLEVNLEPMKSRLKKLLYIRSKINMEIASLRKALTEVTINQEDLQWSETEGSLEFGSILNNGLTYVEVKEDEIEEFYQQEQQLFQQQHVENVLQGPQPIIITSQIEIDENQLSNIENLCEKRRKQSFKPANNNTNSSTIRFQEHFDDLPFQCAECSLAFKCSNNLIRHQHVHMNRFSFQCNMCFQELTLPSQIQRHNIRHNFRNMYRCADCNEMFASWMFLNETSVVLSRCS